MEKAKKITMKVLLWAAVIIVLLYNGVIVKKLGLNPIWENLTWPICYIIYYFVRNRAKKVPQLRRAIVERWSRSTWEAIGFVLLCEIGFGMLVTLHMEGPLAGKFWQVGVAVLTLNVIILLSWLSYDTDEQVKG